MGKVMDLIARETNGKSFNTYRFSYDKVGLPSIDYDNDEKQIRWKEQGETTRQTRPIHLKEAADQVRGDVSILRYFLDGSRHVYKVDDILYNQQVYPVIAGQIGVGCCFRDESRRMHPLKFEPKIVMSLPKASNCDGWSDDAFFSGLTAKVNESGVLRNGIKLDEILYYSASGAGEAGVNLEDRAVARVQDCMIEAEKDMVDALTRKGLLTQDSYLVKDGSLEYKVMGTRGDDQRTLARLKNNYRWVIGVSKSFNPESCLDSKGKPNSDFIANLPVYCRTPAARYVDDMVGKGVAFAVWYVRIHEKRHTFTPFDGVVKVEKLLVTSEEDEYGIETEEADAISAHLINERNPTCYGRDSRWANHIYPVHLTETYVKSKYMGHELFLNLF